MSRKSEKIAESAGRAIGKTIVNVFWFVIQLSLAACLAGSFWALLWVFGLV